MNIFNPAEILGVGDKTGSLKEGKEATLFVSEGDALDFRTNKLTHAFIQGKAIIQFVVNKQGKLEELKLLRDPGSGCGDAAMEVIKKMKDEITWIPGKQRGQKVKVQFTLPITFKL